MERCENREEFCQQESDDNQVDLGDSPVRESKLVCYFGSKLEHIDHAMMGRIKRQKGNKRIIEKKKNNATILSSQMSL